MYHSKAFKANPTILIFNETEPNIWKDFDDNEGFTQGYVSSMADTTQCEARRDPHRTRGVQTPLTREAQQQKYDETRDRLM